MAADTYPTLTKRVGNFNEAVWKPLMSQRLDPGYILETYRYGALENIFDIMDLSQRTMNLFTDTPKVFEKLPRENTVTTGTAITTGAAGASISFTIAAADQDSVVEGDVLIIPGTYQPSGVGDRLYVITDITSHVVTALPKSADGTSVTASQISTQVPSGTVLSVATYTTGRGTGLPDGKYDYRVVRTYNTTILKSSRIYEGGIQALKWYEVPSDVGGSTAFFEGQDDLEFELSKYAEGALWMDEENDNASLTAVSSAGGTNKMKSTKGIWTWAKEVGSALNYPGASFDVSYLYDVKDLFLAKMVGTTEAMFYFGSDLGRYIEEGNLNFISDYSGGSDLFMNANKIGVDIKMAKFHGMTFGFKELKSLSNPQRFGNKVYNFSKSGLIVPEGMEKASYNGTEEKHPSFQIGYLNNNTEDRTRIVGVIDGTTGRSNPSNGNDASQTFALTEFAAVVLRPEQLVYVEPE